MVVGREFKLLFNIVCNLIWVSYCKDMWLVFFKIVILIRVRGKGVEGIVYYRGFCDKDLREKVG